MILLGIRSCDTPCFASRPIGILREHACLRGLKVDWFMRVSAVLCGPYRCISDHASFLSCLAQIQEMCLGS